MSHLSTRISPHPAVTPKLSIGHREKERTSVQSDQSHPCLDLADPHPRRAFTVSKFVAITTSAHQAFSSPPALIHRLDTSQLSRIGSKIISPTRGVFSLSTWFPTVCTTYACLCSRTRLPTKKRERRRLKSLSRSKAAGPCMKPSSNPRNQLAPRRRPYDH